MGGQGSVAGILVGSLLIGVLQNEMVMLNINPFWHKIIRASTLTPDSRVASILPPLINSFLTLPAW